MRNQKIMQWWQGYVVISIQGEKLERLVNQMMSKRFAAWDFRRTSSKEAQLSISLKDFFELRQLLKETGCRVKILYKRGYPFFLKRLRRRLSFVVGVISFCVLLYLFSLMIWSVQIDGVTLPENEALLKEELAKMGIKEGQFKFFVDDPLLVKQKMMEAIPEVTWVGFQFQGTKAILQVVEKTIPEIEEATSPRHLVAKKKAIIHDVFVEVGEPMVKPNQFVRQGELLVSGMIGSEEERQIVSAKGRILGEVWYETNITLPLVRTKRVYTGDLQRKYFLKFGSYPIQVWGFGEKNMLESVRQEEEYLFKWRNWSLPFAWSTETIRATKVVREELTEEAAISLALETSRRALGRKMERGAEIKAEKALRKKIEHGKVYMKVHYTVIEEIGKEQLIIQGE